MALSHMIAISADASAFWGGIHAGEYGLVSGRGLVQDACMFGYSKLAQAGISAVSYLAAVASDGRLAGSAEIAEARKMSRQMIAKVLTILSRHGLVEGTPGPSGGYRLARIPAEITLLDVVRVFDHPDERVMCPFGPHWCGNGSPCPLHDKLVGLHDGVLSQLAGESFEQFQAR